MRKIVRVLAPLCLVVAGVAIAAPAAATKFKDDKEKKGYAIGFQIGSDFARQFKSGQGPDVNLTMIGQGFKDALEGKEGALKPEEITK